MTSATLVRGPTATRVTAPSASPPPSPSAPASAPPSPLAPAPFPAPVAAAAPARSVSAMNPTAVRAPIGAGRHPDLDAFEPALPVVPGRGHRLAHEGPVGARVDRRLRKPA